MSRFSTNSITDALIRSALDIGSIIELDGTGPLIDPIGAGDEYESAEERRITMLTSTMIPSL